MERFKGLHWVQYLKDLPPVVVGGIGGIGSYLVLFLSRLELDIITFDHDTIEKSNMSGQHYLHTDIKKTKCAALKDQVKLFSNVDIETHEEKYVKDSIISPIMFSAFDQMAPRKVMYENWLSEKERLIFIDGRMLAESFEIYVVHRENEAKYRDFLFEDDEVEDLLCSAKATSHCGAITSGFMISGFVNFLTNHFMKADIREVPLKLRYDLEIFNQR